jgi:hypothetical protein
MQGMRWTGMVGCLVVAGLELFHGINYLNDGGTHAVVVAAGITVCMWLAAVGLAFTIWYLVGGFTEGVPWSSAAALFFAALAVALWSRGRRAPSASAENG